MDTLKVIVGGLALLALVVLGLWLWFAGPCWVYTFESAANVPARCLM